MKPCNFTTQNQISQSKHFYEERNLQPNFLPLIFPSVSKNNNINNPKLSNNSNFSSIRVLIYIIKNRKNSVLPHTTCVLHILKPYTRNDRKCEKNKLLIQQITIFYPSIRRFTAIFKGVIHLLRQIRLQQQSCSKCVLVDV